MYLKPAKFSDHPDFVGGIKWSELELQFISDRDAAWAEMLNNLEERIGLLESHGHKLALELECLLLDTKDLPTVSKWWETGMDAVERWERLFPYNGPKLGD